jgi:hypothetical protein
MGTLAKAVWFDEIDSDTPSILGVEQPAVAIGRVVGVDQGQRLGGFLIHLEVIGPVS